MALSSCPPRIDWVSERHVRVCVAEKSTPEAWGRVRAAAGVLRAAGLPGLVDITAAYTTVLLEFDPVALDAAGIEAAIAAIEGSRASELVGRRLVEVPVCYQGEFAPDTEQVAAEAGLAVADVAALHAGAEYVACFVGFQPGFAYLGGLPARLNVPRLDQPRVRIPAGSVGIAGDQTGVYPFASPGGWRLIGRTPVRMFDASRERPSLVNMGDRVKFVPISESEFLAMQGLVGAAGVERSSVGGRRAIRVVEPGMFTTIQDLGRPGFAAMGVPRGGAADVGALMAGNRIVGNDEGLPGLEMTLTGVTLACEEDVVIAVTGGEVEVEIDGVRAGAGGAHRIKAGSRVRVGRLRRGARAYLCLAGGVRVPRVLGSASTNVSAGFGGVDGRVLQMGDRLELGAAVVRRGESVRTAAPDSPRIVRVVAGRGSGFGEAAVSAFVGGEYRVGANSDRVGLRLEGPKLAAPGGGRMISEGMMWGAIQVPQDGRPIVLMCDHPTTGGYPVMACVIAADLPVLGQLRPGEAIRFERVGLDEARAAARQIGSASR